MPSAALAPPVTGSPACRALLTLLSARRDARPAATTLMQIMQESGADAAVLRWPAHAGPRELLQAGPLDAEQQAWLLGVPAAGTQQGPRGLIAATWVPDTDCSLTLCWQRPPAAVVLRAISADSAALLTICRLLARTQDLEEAQRNTMRATRYQAILAESLEWLSNIEQADPRGQINESDIYDGLLRRVRVVCAASGAGLQLLRGNGEPFLWLQHEFPEAFLAAALDWLPPGADSACLWEMPRASGPVTLLRLGVHTPQGLRARLYLYNPSKHDAPPPFSWQDIANTKQLATLSFRTLEKVQLREDLQLSNQFLAMERKDHQRLIAELRSTQQQLLHSEKLASLGQLAAGLAHEINNPVSFLGSNLNMLDQHFHTLQDVMTRAEDLAERHGAPPLQPPEEAAMQREEIREILDESRQGLERVKQIVLDLRNFSRADDTGMQMADLHQCLDSTLSILRHEFRHKVEVVKSYADLPLVECAAGQINQVFMNLLVNAAQAMDKPGRITIRTGQVENRIFVQVEDTGAGISSEHLNRIFDPFFTTKPVGMGTGLGLSLSYGIIQRHHGFIDVDSEKDKGTCFTVWLPVLQPETENDTNPEGAGSAGYLYP